MSQPEHYSIIVADIEASSSLSNDQKTRVRGDLYALLRNAVHASDISWDTCHREDRGDGVYLLVPGTVAKWKLAAPFLKEIDNYLSERKVGDVPMRLRLALNSGEVTLDEQGSSGADVDRTFALVDNQRVRDALAAARTGRMAVVVSDGFYQSVFCGHSDVDPTRFRSYRMKTKGGRVRAWVSVTGVRVQPVVDDNDVDAAAGERSGGQHPSQYGPINVRGGISGPIVQGGVHGPLVHGVGRDFVSGGSVDNHGDQ